MVNLSIGLDSLDIASCKLRSTSNGICLVVLLVVFVVFLLLLASSLPKKMTGNGEEPDEVNVVGESMWSARHNLIKCIAILP